MLGALICATAPSAGANVRILAAFATVYGTAQGVEVSDASLDSGSPPDGVDSTSVAEYAVNLTFSFKVSSAGAVTGAGQGTYAAVHVHLEGHSGPKGAFSCDAPVSGNTFPVVVGGRATGRQALLTLAIPDAAERNGGYTCGARYARHAATSHIMADSLALVGARHLEISLAQPTSWTLTKTVDSRSTDSSENDAHTWTISTMPGGGPVGISAAGASGASCSLALSRLGAKPSQPLAGQPVIVVFRSSAAVEASLLVSKPGRPTVTIASREVPAGDDALVWSGWIGSLPAPASHYQLTVEAKGCGSRRSLAIVVPTH